VSAPATSVGGRPPERLSPWAPLHNKVFAALFAAQLGSNIGTFFQSVSAAWLMGDLTSSPALVALVQTAALMPVLLLGVPAGALADIIDRRKLLIGSQLWMVLASAVLATLTLLDHTTPASLLALTAALGSILCFFLVDTVFGGSLEAGRTAATTTLIVLGLAFVLLLERGPGREHIAIQSYMLAMVAGLGALFALILAAAPVRDFFEMTLLTASEWFLALLCSAIGLTIASLLWRLPQIEELEVPQDA